MDNCVAKESMGSMCLCVLVQQEINMFNLLLCHCDCIRSEAEVPLDLALFGLGLKVELQAQLPDKSREAFSL